LSVDDHGPGVPNSIKDKIFEPFFTTKTHGTGLGLAVVKSVVTAHSGELNVTNIPQSGARFTITLPCDGSRDDAAFNMQSNVA
jgi:two-component system sensor histidine kinase FlrB